MRILCLKLFFMLKWRQFVIGFKKMIDEFHLLETKIINYTTLIGYIIKLYQNNQLKRKLIISSFQIKKIITLIKNNKFTISLSLWTLKSIKSYEFVSFYSSPECSVIFVEFKQFLPSVSDLKN